jgi:hypothetical protein
MVKKGRVR